MITQELVLFIKQQLQEGKSKEQIANMLTPHGWELGDINNVFAQLLPGTTTVASVVMPQASPMNDTVTVSQTITSGQTAAQPVEVLNQVQVQSPANNPFIASNQMAGGGMGMNQMGAAPVGVSAQVGAMAQVGGFAHSLKNPGAVFAGIFLVFSAILGTLLFYFAQMSQPGLEVITSSVDQNSIIGGILAVMLITIIFGGLITKLVAKILSIEPRSFAKSFVFSSAAVVISSIISLLGMVGAPQYAIIIPSLLVWIGLFWYYFDSGIWKAVGAFFLNIIISGIIAGAMIFAAFSIGVGFIVNLTSMLRGTSSSMLAEQEVMMAQIAQDQQAMMLGIQQEMNAAIIANGGSVSSSEAVVMDSDGSSAMTQSAGITPVAPAVNPEFDHVKDSFPVGFPLPKDEDVITATVLSASAFEGVRYILEYTSTNSLAYLRNNMKTALEKAGYSYAINEKDLNYRVITATQVIRDSVRSFRIILKQNGSQATVHAVFNQ